MLIFWVNKSVVNQFVNIVLTSIINGQYKPSIAYLTINQVMAAINIKKTIPKILCGKLKGRTGSGEICFKLTPHDRSESKTKDQNVQKIVPLEEVCNGP